MEITDSPVMASDQIFELEMHSIINILNVVSAQLQLIRMFCTRPEALKKPIALTADLAEAIRQNRRDEVSPPALRKWEELIRERLSMIESEDSSLRDNPEYTDYLETFNQIFQVMDTRVAELDRRRNHPDQWEEFHVNDFRKELVHFLGAVEKNSRGRYRIVYNIAEQETNDYLVHVNIDSDQSDKLYMPLLVKDTIRDLIANARKYTQPGGKIDIGLTIHEGILRFVVEDNGRGIPNNEIEDVVKYGYRGSNIIDEVRTMGDGLGLTKAHYVIHRFGGRLWIDSIDCGGTTIRFELPVQYRSVVETDTTENSELKNSELQPGVFRKQERL